MKKILITIAFSILLSFPGFGQSFDPKGDSLYALQQYKEALPAYLKLSKAENPQPGVLFRLGICYQKTQQYPKALAAYHRLLSKAIGPPFAARVHYNLATVFSLLHKSDSAFHYLKLAANSGFIDPATITEDVDFNSVNTTPAFQKLTNEAKEAWLLAQNPCKDDPFASAFDFWVGEWDVYPTGIPNRKVGLSKIEKFAGGCIVLENWTPLGGGLDGKSFNFVNPTTHKWEQHWVNNQGKGGQMTDYVNGEYKDGAMQFSFTPTQPDGTEGIGRFRFFNVSPDEVRQLQESSFDDGKTWIVNYDLTYIRKKGS